MREREHFLLLTLNIVKRMNILSYYVNAYQPMYMASWTVVGLLEATQSLREKD